MMALDPPKAKPSPTLLFSEAELTQILDACEKYPEQNTYAYDNRKRMRARPPHAVLGAQGRDAVMLKREKVTDGRLMLYTQNTGQPVYVPLPKFLAEALEALNGNSDHFF